MLVDRMRVPVSHVRLLVDQQATLREVQKELRLLAAQGRPDRTLYLFWSGHGTEFEGSGLLASHDGKMRSQAGPDANMFWSQDLRGWLGTVSGARVVIVLDVVAGEAMAGDVEGTGESRRCVPSLPRGVALLAACSWEGKAWANQHGGYFTTALTELAADGLPLPELADRVRSMVEKELEKTGQQAPRNLPVLVDRIGDPAFVPFWSSTPARRSVRK